MIVYQIIKYSDYLMGIKETDNIELVCSDALLGRVNIDTQNLSEWTPICNHHAYMYYSYCPEIALLNPIGSVF